MWPPIVKLLNLRHMWGRIFGLLYPSHTAYTVRGLVAQGRHRGVFQYCFS